MKLFKPFLSDNTWQIARKSGSRSHDPVQKQNIHEIRTEQQASPNLSHAIVPDKEREDCKGESEHDKRVPRVCCRDREKQRIDPEDEQDIEDIAPEYVPDCDAGALFPIATRVVASSGRAVPTATSESPMTA